MLTSEPAENAQVREAKNGPMNLAIHELQARF
jgi:hypothetical protein